MATKLNQNRHITLLASLGSTLEYFDFVIYGMMASYLSIVFFPPQNPTAATLQSFLVFAVGYFARPLGGTIIGIIGDRVGRKPAFLISTSLMACSTLLIALLPNFETLGIAAVLLLVACRMLQGLSFGGELPGAMTIVAEFSPLQRQGHKTSLVIASTSLGALIASSALYLLSAFLSKEEIIAWGWRLPFLGGGVLGLALLIARNTIQETPVFQAFQRDQREHQPFQKLLATHKLSLLRGGALTTFMAALIITNLYLPYYIPKFFAYDISDVYLGTTLSLVFLIIIFPGIGILADALPKKTTTLQWTCASYVILSVPIFSLLSTGNSFVLFVFMMIQQIYIALFSANFFPTLIRIFSPEVRYTGIALCYNLTWAGMATLPMLYTSLLDFYSIPWVVPIILSVIATLPLIALRGIEENLVKSMNNHKEDEPVKYDQAG
jgi:MHS family proline/betaine transporter-like MFS transporter